MALDQFLESCNREQYVHLKPKKFKNLDKMAREADFFAEAGDGISSCVAKEQWQNRDNKGFSKVDKTEIKCRICGKPHPTCKCWNNPDRKVTSSADVGNDEGRLVTASSDSPVMV